jgi:hypothetical protein
MGTCCSSGVIIVRIIMRLFFCKDRENSYELQVTSYKGGVSNSQLSTLNSQLVTCNS